MSEQPVDQHQSSPKHYQVAQVQENEECQSQKNNYHHHFQHRRGEDIPLEHIDSSLLNPQLPKYNNIVDERSNDSVFPDNILRESSTGIMPSSSSQPPLKTSFRHNDQRQQNFQQKSQCMEEMIRKETIRHLELAWEAQRLLAHSCRENSTTHKRDEPNK